MNDINILEFTLLLGSIFGVIIAAAATMLYMWGPQRFEEKKKKL